MFPPRNVGATTHDPTYMAEYERPMLDAERSSAAAGKRMLAGHCWQHFPPEAHAEHGLRHDRDEGGRALDYRAAKANIGALRRMVAALEGQTLTRRPVASTASPPVRTRWTVCAAPAVMCALRLGGGGRHAHRLLWGNGRARGMGGCTDRLYHGASTAGSVAVLAQRANIDDRIDQIARQRPKAVVGYVAPVALVARRMLQTGRTIAGVRSVLTGAEALYDPERRDIERAFGCAVFNTYGSREVMLMATECDRHKADVTLSPCPGDERR